MAKFATSKWLRLVVYSLTCALSIVCIGLSINALVTSARVFFSPSSQADKLRPCFRANRDISNAKRLALQIAPAGTHIYSSIQDIRIPGAFLTTGEALLGLVGLFSLLNILFHISDSKSTRFGTIVLWAFGLLWTVPSAIASLVIARQRSIKVTADIGGVKVPDAVVRYVDLTGHI
jgi:hypothetical protein